MPPDMSSVPPSVFILGALGFLGYNCTQHFAQNGWKVSGMSLTEPTLPLHENVSIQVKNLFHLTDDEIIAELKGNSVFVYAAGADERVCPKAPASAFFYEQNVLPTIRMVRLAAAAGVKKFVLFGSYFTYFAHKWVDLELHETAYIQNRFVQECCAFNEGSIHGIDVCSLRLPYIFGVTPGTIPLWSMYLGMVLDKDTIYVPNGSTAAVTNHQVAEACFGAALNGKHRCHYELCGQNISFSQFYQLYVAALGQTSAVVPCPPETFLSGMIQAEAACAEQGKEHGVHLDIMCKIQARDATFDEMINVDVLQYSREDVIASISETLKFVKQAYDEGKIKLQ